MCTETIGGNFVTGSESTGRKKCRSSSFSYASVLPVCLSFLALHVGTINAEVRSPPLITKQPPTDTILFQVAKRIDENDKPFIIECEADGTPEPQYSWMKNNKEFNWQRYDNRILQQPGRGTLVFTEPRDEDIGQYQCFATNTLGTATSNSVFLRKAVLEGFKDDVDVVVKTAEEGKPFSLPCNTPDGYPKPGVYWFLQNTQGALRNINSSRITVDPKGTLWFSSVTTLDGSEDFVYACSAFSPFRHDYKLGNRVSLKVNSTTDSTLEKHQPTQQYMSKRRTVAIRGQTLELWCIVGGTPLPEIRWSKKAGSLPADRVSYDNYGKSMRISKVNFKDAGIYNCNASNGVGQPVSYSIDIKVESAPYFKIEPQVVNAAEGQTVKFKCTAGGVPRPIIQWIHNGKPIEEATPNPRRTLKTNKIVIRKVLKTDTGNYGCKASNHLGYVYKDVYVNVLSK